MSLMKKTVLATLLALASLVGCSGGGGAAPVAAAIDAPPTITVAVAEGRTVPDTLALSGTLLADEDSRLAPVLPGRVVEVLVDRGDVVTQGQPLVRLRDADQRLQAQAARAQLAQARARLGIAPGARPPSAEDTPEVRSAAASLSLAEDSLRRSEELSQRGVLAPAQLDEVRARASQARDQQAVALQNARASIAALGAAEAQASLASTALSESIVRAPFAGEIADRSVSPGEYVTVQTPLLTLVRTDPMRLELQVPQERVGAISAEQRVVLTVDAFADASFEGRVRYVSAAVDRASRALVVEAVVPNPDGRLRPGMFVQARIELGGQLSVAIVPLGAVMTSAGVSRVFVVRDGTIEERVVTVMERNATEVVIARGVSAGETLATNQLDRLTDGVRVTVGAAAPAAAPSAAAVPAPSTPPAGGS